MFFNIIKHTLKNIVRNKFLTFSSILVIGLLMFFINILIILHEVSIKIIDNINDKISINLYLKEDIDKTSKSYKDFKNEIKKVSSTIHIDYKTKKDILEKYKTEEPEFVNIIK
jgi:cell division transport system permease protein